MVGWSDYYDDGDSDAVFPSSFQVASGVIYGPDGDDFVGSAAFGVPYQANPPKIQMTQSDTWNATILGIVNVPANPIFIFMAKWSVHQPDSEAMLAIRSDTGITRLRGAAPPDPSHGSIVYSSGLGALTLHLDEEASELIDTGTYRWSIKSIGENVYTTHVEKSILEVFPGAIDEN